MMTVLLWLLKEIGIKRIAGWALRLVQLAVLGGLLVIAVAVLWRYKGAQEAALIIAALVFSTAVLRALWPRRKTEEAETGERTIDGKVVPEKLAAAALAVPHQSPDGDYVLRGLPDFGKVLLKLDPAEFEYVPESPEKEIPEAPPLEEPRGPRRWPRWVMAGGAAALLLLVAGIGLYHMAQSSRAEEVARSRALEIEPVKAENLQRASGADVQSAAPSQPEQGAATSGPEGQTAVTWRDATTGLLWPMTDNGVQPLDYEEAKLYCRSLSLDNLSGWRLPSFNEMAALSDDTNGGLRGGIRPTKLPVFYWSSTRHGTRADGIQLGTIPVGHSADFARALCVHD